MRASTLAVLLTIAASVNAKFAIPDAAKLVARAESPQTPVIQTHLALMLHHHLMNLDLLDLLEQDLQDLPVLLLNLQALQALQDLPVLLLNLQDLQGLQDHLTLLVQIPVLVLIVLLLA